MKIEQILNDLKCQSEKADALMREAQRDAVYKEGISVGMRLMLERIDNMTRLRPWKDEEHEAMQARINQLQGHVNQLKGYLNEIAVTLERDGRFAKTVTEIRKAVAETI